MKLVYIHGANASSESFNYIRQHIKQECVLINYDSKNGFKKNLEQMKNVLSLEEKMFFICHSLGGVYALHLAGELNDRVAGAVSLSTPYGGAEVAELVKYFMPYSQLMKDIEPNSWAMRHSRNAKITAPWTNIVTTRGDSPLFARPNDGVVTVASQRARADSMELIDLDCNHYEVVLNDTVINIIKERLERIHA